LLAGSIAFLSYAENPFLNSGKDREIIIQGSRTSPPFEFLNKEEKPAGFDVELVTAALKAAGYENYIILLDDYRTSLRNVVKGDADILLGAEEKADKSDSLLYSIPTCTMNCNYITYQKSDIKCLADFRDKEIMVEKGSWAEHYLETMGIRENIYYIRTISEGINMLHKGMHDILMANGLTAHYIITKQNISGMEVRPLNVPPTQYVFATGLKGKELLNNINAGLRKIMADGTYDKIYGKWFFYDSEKKYMKTIFKIVLLAILMAAALSIFIFMLRKNVAKATRKLNYFRQELELAMRAGDIVAWTYDTNNKHLKRIHEFSSFSSGSGIPFSEDLTHFLPNDREKVRKAIDDISAGLKDSAYLQFGYRNQDGSISYIETNMQSLKNTSGIPYRIVGTEKDITEDREMQKKLEQYYTKVQFINKANDLTLMQYNPQKHEIQILSNEYENMSVIYTKKNYLQMVDPADMEIADIFFRNMDNSTSQTVNAEFRMKTSHNDMACYLYDIYQWYAFHTTAYEFDENGKITDYLGIKRNNNKWRILNENLIKLKNKADSANKLKSTFLANMSHEIRNPLNAIVGFSDLMCGDVSENEKEQYVSIINTNNEMLLQLINDVIDLSKIESGSYELDYTSFNLRKFMEELTISLQINKPPKVSIFCECPFDIEIYADRLRITQIITNFVHNAGKFTKSGSIKIYYRIENDEILIAVKDTGIGIEPENQKKIFDRFEKLNHSIQGSGLGLSICKGLVKLMNGTIGVESSPGKGSTFWFRIPYKKKE
jgi:signal transduction histidine kinase/ABC-type amino acid transport substrate-binding protein